MGRALSAFVGALRSGDFVTRERIRLVSLALIVAFAVALAYMAATAHGRNDAMGRPLGTDFSNVYAAGTYVLDGEPAAPFDPARQYVREQQIFGSATPFYGWHYPPFFLGVAAALAIFPYVPALVLWQAATLLLYLLAIRAIVMGEGRSPDERSDIRDDEGTAVPGYRCAHPGYRLWPLLAVAFPAVFVNLGHGHNGLLTAALIGGALVLLDRRPLIAGILFGLLVYKPQFGILIPLVLVATGRWKCFAAAALTVAALALVTTLAFGSEVWTAFFDSTHFTRAVVLEAGGTGWHKIQSVFATVRMWGGSVALAYAVQSIVTLALAAALVWLWRLKVDYALKAAALVIAAILATPYSLDYDMTALAPAIAFLAMHGVREGFAPYEKTALAALWLAPLVARGVAEATLIPLGVTAMIAVFALILCRAAQECGLFNRWRATGYPAG
jgi:alpha-1,2-mannosyltransferase